MTDNTEQKLMVFSHNDLDCIGCLLATEFKFPDVPKEYFYTNYANIDAIVKEIKAFISKTGSKHLLIADVSFSDNKPALKELYDLGLSITHIDHHQYPEGFWDEFPNMKVHYNKGKSATLLCNEYFENTGKNPNLDKLTRLIDVYDIWQTKEPEFDTTQDINEYFWAKTKTQGLSIEQLMHEIIDCGWRLPNDYSSLVAGIREQYTSDIADYEKRGLINRAGDITLCLIPDWFNHVMIEEMKNGQNFVIGINQYGIVRIRINQDAPYTKEQKDAIRLKTTGNVNMGHAEAFTYRYEEPITFDNTMNEAKRVIGIINSEVQM